MDDAAARAYADASRFFVDAVSRVPIGGWEEPGLGTWSVRDLVGHINRAHTLIGEYLTHPVAAEQPGSPYFSDEAIAERGRQAVAALSGDPLQAVSEASAAAIALIERTEPDAVLGTPFGQQTLAGYLPSRTAELTIHTLDLLRALDLLKAPDVLGAQGVEAQPPAAALAESLRFVAERAAGRSGVEVLRALTGRGALPEGYSVY